MSDAPFLTASVSTRFTSLMTGASSDSFASALTSTSSASWTRSMSESSKSPITSSSEAGLVVVLSTARRIASSAATTGWMLYPVRNLMSSSAKMLRRVGGRQDQRRAGPVHRDHGVLDRDLLGDQLDHGGLDLELVEIDRGHAVLLGDEVGELVLVQEAELGDLRAEPAALGAGLLARLAQLLRAEEVLLDEKLPDPLVHVTPPTPRRGTRTGTHACAAGCARNSL